MELNCSDEFPTTETLYRYITSETAVLILTIIVSVIVPVIFALFFEEVWFLFKHYKDSSKRTKIIFLLALYPIVSLSSLLCLLVPASTLIGEFVSSIYLSFCIFTFVNLTVEYFGGANGMLIEYTDETISFRTGPICCCFCCLNKVPFKRTTLTVLTVMVLQVAILNPLISFILAVLWTDDKYSITAQNDFATPGLYLVLFKGVSTLLALYGLMVTFRATNVKLNMYRMTLKFGCLKGAIIFMNLQSFILGFLGRAGIPECFKSVGSPVRASRTHHLLLIGEMFLFAIVARFAYRRIEEKYAPPGSYGSTHDSANGRTVIEPTLDKTNVIKTSSASSPISRDVVL